MSEITLASTVSRAQDLIATELDGEIVIFDAEKGVYFGLEDTGHKVWSLLDQPHTVESLCTTLCGLYEVDRAVCEQDVLHFLNEMDQEGLIIVG